MNSFGTFFKVQVFGESHGLYIGVTIDGVPAGIPLNDADFTEDLQRRQGSQSKGTTPRKESDIPKIISGYFNEHTTGAPLTILFENTNIRSNDYDKIRAIPRPGHADFVAHKKFNGFQDYRGGGHFSARITVGIVAAGVIAKKILNSLNINIESTIIEVGGCSDIEEGIKKAIEHKDSVGAIIRTTAENIPIGWGNPFWNSLESLLAHAIFAIPAVKGIAFGSGFEAARMFGSEHNDAIVDDSGKTATNHAGGIVGGLSNGNTIVFDTAFKPTSSTPKEQTSWNWQEKNMQTFNIKGRHDLCVALRAPAIVEAMTAIVLVDAYLTENIAPQ